MPSRGSDDDDEAMNDPEAIRELIAHNERQLAGLRDLNAPVLPLVGQPEFVTICSQTRSNPYDLERHRLAIQLELSARAQAMDDDYKAAFCSLFEKKFPNHTIRFAYRNAMEDPSKRTFFEFARVVTDHFWEVHPQSEAITPPSLFASPTVSWSPSQSMIMRATDQFVKIEDSPRQPRRRRTDRRKRNPTGLATGSDWRSRLRQRGRDGRAVTKEDQKTKRR